MRAALVTACLQTVGCGGARPSVEQLATRGTTAFGGVEIVAAANGNVTIDAPVTASGGALVVVALLLLALCTFSPIPMALGKGRGVWATRLYVPVMAGMFLYVLGLSISHYLVDRHAVIDVSRQRIEIERSYLYGRRSESLPFADVRDLRVVWLQGRGSRYYTLRLRTDADELWLLTYVGDGDGLAALEELRDDLATRLKCKTSESVGRLFPR